MAENNGAAPQAEQGPRFSIEKVYIRDASFEVPNAPMVFTERAEPKIDVQLAQNVSNFQPELFEVVLKVTVTCKQGDKTTYLCEVQQAGVFGIGGFEAQAVDQILGIECPNILFPYLRQAVNQAITDGGFAPFQLSPINFAALYQQALQQRAAQQGGELPNA